jgi:hypothetical protein
MTSGVYLARSTIILAIGLVACRRSEPPAPTNATPRTPHVAPITGDDDSCDPAKPKICLGDDVVACEPDGHLGRRMRACHKGCADGKCQNTCEDESTKLIYLVDTANDFLSFDPRLLPKNPIKVIGKLRCGRHWGSPFSMSVDRNGTAWVVYDNGEMFKVDITDAKCEASGYAAGASGSITFGMGFVTDKPGGDTEKLYLAANDSSHALHSIDTAHGLVPRRVGTITGGDDRNPELTGTSEAHLYGFYPSLFESAYVQEIDKHSGSPVGKKWTLGSDPLGDVTAYAFAQWGGVFYIFATIDDGFDSNSTVRTVDRTTGAYRTIMTHLPYRISGAGVSTCAPERDASTSPPQGMPSQGP